MSRPQPSYGGSVVGTVRYATPMDAHAHGEHRITAAVSRSPVRCFVGRISADGSGPFPAEPGRYHLYAGWFCPWSHRATLQRALNGLTEVISVSYVDGLRDARGWAFRPATGPDDVNGFALLREAYELSAPGYDGNVTVPVLWDRVSRRIVSNDPTTIDLDVATAFQAWSAGRSTHPPLFATQIAELDRWIGPRVNQPLGRAVYDAAAREQLLGALAELDRRLARRRYLLGETITTADVRLWVSLVRYDAGPNAHGAVGPRLDGFANLWRYARELYALAAFRDTTRFAAFAAPFANLPDWSAQGRGGVVAS